DLTRHFDNCAGTLLGLQACMRGLAMNLEREHPGALSASLHSTCRGRWLDHQHLLRAFSFSFNERSARQASRLFIASQKQNDWPARLDVKRRAATNCFNRQRAVRFHVEDAGTVSSIPFHPPRPALQRSDWMNSIGVSDDKHGL